MKVSDRARRILRRAAVLLITVAVILVGLSWVERERNKEEEYAVYSAYLSEGLLNDAHDLSTGGPVQVVIRDTTLPPGNLRFRLFYLFDGRARFGELHTLTLASYLARNLFQTRIQGKFVLPKRATVCFTPDSEYFSPEFKESSRATWGWSPFLVSVSTHLGLKLCFTSTIFVVLRSGRYVLMEKVSGVWSVRDEHYTWIS